MNSSSPFSTGTAGSKPPLVLSHANPKALKRHPRNSAIYGEDEGVTELISLIRDSGWVKPLVVTTNGTIISGHRRWKAVLALGWESVPVEEREFQDELAELEALLLENASRFKTIEQKVREALVWKELEVSKAKKRQLATQNNNAGKAVVENFPQLLQEKGKTRDRIAARVGLGSGRTYSKAAKVVERIDALVESGDREKALALRQVLNEKSVDAAMRLLSPTKNGAYPARSSNVFDQTQAYSEEESDDPFREGYTVVFDPRNTSDRHTSYSQRSCWNCQHRGELVENHSFYCNRLGVQNLLNKSADTRGTECDLWNYRGADYDEAENKTQPTDSTFTLTLPAHLQPLLQDAACTTGVSVVDWVTKVLESVALATCCTSSCTETDAPAQNLKTACQAVI